MNHEVDAQIRLSMEERNRAGIYCREIMSKTGLRLAAACAVSLCSWLGTAPLHAKRAPDPAFKTLDVFAVLIAAHNLHTRMLTLIHSGSQKGTWRPGLES